LCRGLIRKRGRRRDEKKRGDGCEELHVEDLHGNWLTVLCSAAMALIRKIGDRPLGAAVC
jgi:hypothetical protein